MKACNFGVFLCVPLPKRDSMYANFVMPAPQKRQDTAEYRSGIGLCPFR